MWTRKNAKDIKEGSKVQCLVPWPIEALPVKGTPVPTRRIEGLLRGTRVVSGSVSAPAHHAKKVELEVWTDP